jgi:uncharacterized lipoprotein YddW (UPF0748 family)
MPQPPGPPDEPRVDYPALRREFRGVWVATVTNIDWPSRRGLASGMQQAEATALLDQARALNLNAVVLQVRPSCDAFYPSRLEPWSEYLSGQSGRGPQPAYDPLAFWIDEAHRRGLELHAWFNPYRAALPSAGPLSAAHIVKRRPDLVRAYGAYFWLDPGEPEVAEHTTSVVLDVVTRYDIDGVHLDDYFYPYKSYANGADFPDDVSYRKYQAGGGTLRRADWRRQNVNQLVAGLYAAIKERRPQVKFGISPFGIWRPGYPPGIQGLSAYDELYADARLWLNQGWVDYFSPQLYWRIDQAAQSYTALLDWWLGENHKGVHLWPGNNASLPAQEIAAQLQATRARRGATGNIHYNMRALATDRGGLATLLRMGPYREPALVPPSPWLGEQIPPAPAATAARGGRPGEVVLTLQAPQAFLFVVHLQEGAGWRTRVVPAEGGAGTVTLADLPAGRPVVGISAVDRLGNEGPKIRVELEVPL